MRRTLAVAALLAAALPLAAHAEEPSRSAACLAEAVYYEARGTSPAAQAAVAHVVLNRVEHPEFPDSPCDVVEDSCQFSYRCDGKPERMADPADRAEAFLTAEQVLEGDLGDPTGGALFFHAEEAGATDFHETRPHAADLGGNVFYR